MGRKCEREANAPSRAGRRDANGNPTSPTSHPVVSRRKQRAPGSPVLRSGAQAAYEELLQFFNHSEDLLCIAGLDGRFKLLNPAWQPALGWSREELQARPFLDFVHPDDRSATRAEMAKLGSGTTTITFENRYQCKDGSCKWLQWTSSPLPGGKESFAIARNVTRRKRMEEEILAIVDSERKRMGRELHDGCCQSMAAIAALCAALARKLPRAAASESALACEINSLLGQSIQQVRDLARGLDPVSLKSLGLVAAFTDFCSNTEAVFGITCKFRCEPRPRKLNTHREAHLFRIAQEAVNNAIAHGQAQSIDVVLSFQNGQGTLAIQDDGIGFCDASDHQPDPRPGIGLHTMTYRARQIGGSLDVKRLSPRGTLVTCVFRLPSAGPQVDRLHGIEKNQTKGVGQNSHSPS